MKRNISRNLRNRKHRVGQRLANAQGIGDLGRPVFSGRGVKYEMSRRTRAIAHGGIGAVHQVALQSGLVRNIDQNLEVLKQHRPYYESDHVLNIAYNAMCGGQTLEDIDHRRNDEVFLDALGAVAIPDPTTAGDFCRRFETQDVLTLMNAVNEARLAVWARQGPEFTQETARIDVDGTVLGTTGECKEGMSLNYKGVWGYHPLLVSLANTAEPLFIANRSGNRPSHEGAAGYLDEAIALCRRAGFSDVLLRGDTDFSMTREFDRWHEDGVRFVFGYDAKQNLKRLAGSLDATEYSELERQAREAFKRRKSRAKAPRVKEQVVREKGYKNIRLRSEDIAEFDYKPTACGRPYRVVVLRKNLTVEQGKPGQQTLFDDVRYFFYVTNDWNMSAKQVVFESNRRCNQENLIEQLKNGVRALHAPVNTLNANWAYMVMCSLAWSLKAWMALWLPITRHRHKSDRADRDRWLRMDFRTFRAAVIDVPAQVVNTGRRLVYRFLAWRPQLPVFFRLLDAL